MRTDYTKYKDIDFLEDDFFVKSMTSPTKDSKLFWADLVDNKKINVNEFISANMLLERMRNSKEEMPLSKRKQLWNKIESTRNDLQRKTIRRSRNKFMLIAACSVGIVFGLTLMLLLPAKNDLEEKNINYSELQSFKKGKNNNEIIITSKDKQITIEGKNAEIKYDSIGSFTVNKKTIHSDTITEPAASEISYTQLSVPYGKRVTLTLADGSCLWVNSGTTVIYPTIFSGNKREIFIEGEIYAEISHDEKRPFIIKTDRLEISVLGTSFNLSAYRDDSFKRIVLVSGSVKINENGTNTQLKPNQAYTSSQGEYNIETVNTEIYTSWREGLYIFQDEPIGNILQQLGRYYNVTMLFPSEPSGILCSGKLELKEDIAHILSNLSQIGSFNYGAKGNDYKIQFY